MFLIPPQQKFGRNLSWGSCLTSVKILWTSFDCGWGVHMKINFLFVYRFLGSICHTPKLNITEPRSEWKQQSTNFALIQIGLSTTDQRKMVNNSQHLYYLLMCKGALIAVRYSIDHSGKKFMVLWEKITETTLSKKFGLFWMNQLL